MGSKVTVLFILCLLMIAMQFSAQDNGCECQPAAMSASLPLVSEELTYQQIYELASNVDDIYNGERLYHGSTYGCVGCHSVDKVAPLTEIIWDTVVNERMLLEQFERYTPEQYVIESILSPDNYIVNGYPNTMPHNYGDRLYQQELIDMVAYLKSFWTRE